MGWVDGIRERMLDEWMRWEKGYGMSGWEKRYGMSGWDKRKDIGWVGGIRERIWDEWMG